MRLLALIAAIGFLIYFVNSWLKLRNLKPPAGARKAQEPEKMVRCHLCDSHLPESRAIRHGELSFCSREHLRQYLTHED